MREEDILAAISKVNLSEFEDIVKVNTKEPPQLNSDLHAYSPESMENKRVETIPEEEDEYMQSSMSSMVSPFSV